MNVYLHDNIMDTPYCGHDVALCAGDCVCVEE